MSKINLAIEYLVEMLNVAKSQQRKAVTFGLSLALSELRRLSSTEQAGAIKKASELTDDGYYWYRVTPSGEWKILHITNPQRLSYGIGGFEFLGPVPAPAE